MAVNETNVSGVFKMIYSKDNDLLLVGCNGLLGLLAFDMRKLSKKFYIPTHDYPLLAMDCGEKVLNNIAATSGTTTSYRYVISVHDLSNPRQNCTKLVPGHRAVVTSLRIGEDMIISGSKNGSLIGVTFKRSKETLRRTKSGYSHRIRSN